MRKRKSVRPKKSEPPKKLFSIPSWDSYFMNIANVVKTRGNCLLIQVGVVLVQGKRIIATGYNGTPAKLPNCLDGGCARCRDKFEGKIKSGENKGACLCVHAEVNSILQSAMHGTATKGAVIYTTLSPCLLCVKEIINAGITGLVYQTLDEGELNSIKLLKNSLGSKNVRQIKA